MINKVIIAGNIGADPELKYSQSGITSANFNVVTIWKWKNQNGQQQEKAEWHRIVATGHLSDICGDYLQKGSKVYIEGRIQTRHWDDQDGKKRYTTEIVADKINILDPL